MTEQRTYIAIDLKSFYASVSMPNSSSTMPGVGNPARQTRLTYFVPDQRKQGGAYTSVTGQIKKVDRYERSIIMTDGRKIPFEHIADLDKLVDDLAKGKGLFQ